MTTLPCPDPEGCRHFQNETKLEERIKELEKGGYIRHKHNCFMGEYNSFLTGKGCSCGLSQALKG